MAAVLLAAIVIAGLRNESTARPGRPPATPTVTTPDPRTELGSIYRENSCPDPDRGACFEPFPAGRYTFHKSNPQITITVGDGWRNDSSFPTETLLSRPDTPGAFIDVLMDAHASSSGECDVAAIPGASNKAVDLAGRLAADPELITTKPVRARLGELDGYVLDLAPRPGGHPVTCSDGFVGVTFLTSVRSDVNGGNWWGFGLGSDQRARLLIADTSLGRTVVVATVVTGSESDLQSWLTKAQPVVNSITFAPCAHRGGFFGACEPVLPPTASP